jgi:hypothetical protein
MKWQQIVSLSTSPLRTMPRKRIVNARVATKSGAVEPGLANDVDQGVSGAMPRSKRLGEAIAAQPLLDAFTQVLQQMKVVSDLARLWCALPGALGIEPAPVTADDLDLGRSLSHWRCSWQSVPTTRRRSVVAPGPGVEKSRSVRRPPCGDRGQPIGLLLPPLR